MSMYTIPFSPSSCQSLSSLFSALSAQHLSQGNRHSEVKGLALPNASVNTNARFIGLVLSTSDSALQGLVQATCPPDPRCCHDLLEVFALHRDKWMSKVEKYATKKDFFAKRRLIRLIDEMEEWLTDPNAGRTDALIKVVIDRASTVGTGEQELLFAQMNPNRTVHMVSRERVVPMAVVYSDRAETSQ